MVTHKPSFTLHCSVPNLATWIREVDEPHFAPFLKMRPALRVFNARTANVDLAAMDGLLLSGGTDIAAEFLDQEVSDPSLIRSPDAERDKWEFAALRELMRREKPILAICKGMQVLNVALGGTLHLDIKGHNQREGWTADIQPLRTADGATVRFELVNSSHHQAIDRLAQELEIEAWCERDDIIEQVRIRDYPFGLGVQYHPERGTGYARLFEQFFDGLPA
jgi:putative glutamine amidotransferase